MEKFNSQEEFVSYIAPIVQRACKRMWVETGLDHPLVWPSVVIAQCCHENGYGMDPKCYCLNLANNFVGIKAELLNKSWVPECSVWDGRALNKQTPEVYNNQQVQILDDFRIYDEAEQGIMDYLLFLRYGGYQKGVPKYYDELKTLKDPYAQIRLIHKKGYATGVAYSDRIIEKIQKWHLIEKYDEPLVNVEVSKWWPKGLASVVDKDKSQGGDKMNIKINPNPYGAVTNKTSKRPGGIDYIYIHYVGALGTAKDNVVYYSTDNVVKASADLYVSQNGEIWQYNMLIPSRYCWAVGGGRQSQYGGSFYKKATNANGVSIEMCLKSKNGKAPANPNDPNWYITEETFKNTVELTKYLMKTYNVPAERVIRHYDVNGKYCPGVYGWNAQSGSEKEWLRFKEAIKGTPIAPVEPSKPEKPVQGNKVWKVQLGAYKRKGNAINKLHMAQEKIAKDAFITDLCPDGYYRVQVGCFSIYDNAVNLMNKIKNDKLSDACIKEYDI